MNEITLKTGIGSFLGNEHDTAYEFLGVPYAKAKRFEYCERTDSYEGIVDARTMGNACPQYRQCYPHLDKPERLIRYGLLGSCILYVTLYIALMVTNVNPWVYAVWSNCALGFANISIYMQWGLVGEAIDYNEMITGKRTEGSIYGTFNLSRRVGQTIGNSAAMLLLGWIGYNGMAAVQEAATINGIKTLTVLLPGILVLGSWASFKFLWNMDDEMRAKVYEFKVGKKISE